MAITSAAFRGYTRQGNNYKVAVRLIDSVRGTYDRTFDASGTTVGELQVSITKQIADLIASDSSNDALAGIPVDAVIPITVTPPVQAELDDAAWLAQVRQLERAQLLKSTGMDAAQFLTDFTALSNAVKAGYTTARGGKL